MNHNRSLLMNLLALVGGCLFPLGFSPFEFGYLAPLSLVLLFYAWRGGSPATAAVRGYLFGLGQFGVGTSWVYISMQEYGGASVAAAGGLTLLLVVFLALFPALVGWLAMRLFSAPSRLRALVVVPALWILSELVRGAWTLGGFPWLLAGYSQIDTPLGGYGPLFGVYGIGWLTALTAALVVEIIKGRGRRLSALVLVSVWLGGGLLSQVQWTRTTGVPFRATLIQGNVAQDLKFRPDHLQTQLDLYVDMTRRHWDSDLVVWPETALPLFYHQVEAGYLAPLEQEANAHDTDLLVGLPVMGSSSKEYYNALISLGKSRGIYRKRHLVPFGEYLPLQPLSGFITDLLEIPLGNFSAGDVDQPLLEAAGYPLVATICYEDAFGSDNRIGLPQGAYLVNVTNDGWFGDSIAPHQHLQMARMRSLETGRYMLRATNTGITAVISADGAVVASAPQFVTTALSAEISAMTGITPYILFGDTPVVIGVFLAVAWASLGRGRHAADAVAESAGS